MLPESCIEDRNRNYRNYFLHVEEEYVHINGGCVMVQIDACLSQHERDDVLLYISAIITHIYLIRTGSFCYLNLVQTK